MSDVAEGSRNDAALVLDELAKCFECDGARLPVLEPTSIRVKRGELFVMLGPSGCGKTTVLRIIAGLEPPSSGEVRLDGRRVQGPSPERGMVFQDFTSFAWLTVSENIAFGLRLRPHDPGEVRQTVADWVRKVGLDGFESFYPRDLSGGMQQRVAIARTLAVQPKLVLMDEPFGSLDAQARWQMQEMLLNLRRESPTTIVFVTHDVEEAIFLGDRIAVFSPRPARLLREFSVPYGVTRDRSITRAAPFIEMERQIHVAMRGEV
ncbi:MAG: ABC transporter ATP-binding protein [Planctomycetes bacterium]|nr:ABC transporter ATP-binding protein [Planctomycetota bacterium]